MCSQLGQTSLNWLQPTKLEVDVMGQGNVFTSVCLSTGGTPGTAHFPWQQPPRTEMPMLSILHVCEKLDYHDLILNLILVLLEVPLALEEGPTATQASGGPANRRNPDGIGNKQASAEIHLNFLQFSATILPCDC